jgi:hypothetical protein
VKRVHAIAAIGAIVATGCSFSSGTPSVDSGLPEIDASSPAPDIDGSAANGTDAAHGEAGLDAGSLPDAPGAVDAGPDATLLADAGMDAAALPSDGSTDAGADALVPPDGALSVCTPTGSMAAARVSALAVSLNDGTVLVAGGLDTNTQHMLASAERFDPSTGLFSPAGSMSTERVYGEASLLADGRVLVTGGVDDAGQAVASADLYDPVAGTWSPAGAMSVARAAHASVTLADGRVLVMGGIGSVSSFDRVHDDIYTGQSAASSADVFDPASGTFGPAGTMTSPRAFLGATRMLGGNVLLAGGFGTSVYMGTAEEYVVSAADGGAPDGAAPGAFAAVPSFPDGIGGIPLLAPLPNGQTLAFVLGGLLESTVVASGGPTFLFDPATSTFSVAPFDLIHASEGIALANGDVYGVVGSDGTTVTAETEVYESAANAWRPSASTTAVHYLSALANVPGGRVLVAGGCPTNGCGSADLATAEICTP